MANGGIWRGWVKGMGDGGWVWKMGDWYLKRKAPKGLWGWFGLVSGRSAEVKMANFL